ncbi:MAG: hypothetical protein AAGA85_10970 [Bacteroidota bacterium]
MKTLIITFLAASIASVAFSQGSKSQLRNLSGTYTSLQAEDWGRGTFGFRTFTFDDGQWTLRFQLALDPQMQQKVFEFRTYGTYQVQEKAKTVAAYEALFLEEEKFVTLLTDNPELIEGFGLAECGLIPFEEKNISKEGCALWPSVEVCSEDHDLLALDAAGQLFFGVRPPDNDMCTADKRPVALLPAVKRQVNP